MAGYWPVVLQGAWDKTYKPLGWDRKKLGLALIAVGTIIVAGFQMGWGEMVTTAAGYVWIAAPAAFAAAVLFVWGIIETQAKMHSETNSKIGDLEALLAQAKEPPPNYEAWRHKETLTLWQVAFLWSDLEPRMSMAITVRPWFEGLKGAIQKGELEFVPKMHISHGFQRESTRLQKENPNGETVVTRKQLRAFAALHDYHPRFLEA